MQPYCEFHCHPRHESTIPNTFDKVLFNGGRIFVVVVCSLTGIRIRENSFEYSLGSQFFFLRSGFGAVPCLKQYFERFLKIQLVAHREGIDSLEYAFDFVKLRQQVLAHLNEYLASFGDAATRLD